MSVLLQDLRQAFRRWAKAPGFTLIAAATLAIGIGANTAIFSIVDAVLLRPLPFRSPEQLVRLYETESAPGKYPFAGADYADWKAQNSTFQDMTLFGWRNDFNLSGEGRPDHVLGVPTEANFFSLLGVEPLLGRTFAKGEDQPGNNKVAVLGYALWRSRFGGDPNVTGKTIELNAEKYKVVGVMPADFLFPFQAQLWIPLDMSAKGLGTRGSHWANSVGRMKPGVSLKTAHADLSLIASRLEKSFPDSNHKVGATVAALHEDLVGRSRDSLLMMLCAVGLVLLIACANVANLLLSRAVARQKEMAIRGALGAGRMRLLRQLLTESVALALAGSGLGLLLGWGAIEAFSKLESTSLPRFAVVHLDTTVLAFTCVLALATGILFGIYPALQTSRPDLHEELKGGSGSSISQGRRRRFTSNTLVVCEFALSVLLLASAGLLLKDFARMRSLDIGVCPEGVWTATISMPEARYGDYASRSRFAESLRAQASEIPGVDAAAVSTKLPLEGGSNYYINVRGQASAPMSGPLVESHAISPGYFRAMGIRLLKGRLFTLADVQAAAVLNEKLWQYRDSEERPAPELTNGMIYPVVINETMVKTFWPDEDPIGKMYAHGNNSGPWQHVVGVVSDVRQWGLADPPRPEAYDIFGGNGRFNLVLHTTMEPAALTPEVRGRLERLDPSLSLFSVRTMDQVVADHAQGQRFLSLLIGSFAGLAMLLAAIGIYGVLSYAVTQRTREIGIRMVLGASRWRVLATVLREGAVLAAIGFAAGMAGAWASGRVLANLLHEVRPGDPTVLLAAGGVLAAVALVACYLPARRAASLDPMNAIRYE